MPSVFLAPWRPALFRFTFTNSLWKRMANWRQGPARFTGASDFVGLPCSPNALSESLSSQWRKWWFWPRAPGLLCEVWVKGFFSWPNCLMATNCPNSAKKFCKLKVTASALSISPCGLSSRFHLTAALAHPRVALAKVLLQGSHVVELCVVVCCVQVVSCVLEIFLEASPYFSGLTI